MYCFVSNGNIEYELFWTITKLVPVGIGTKPTRKIETSAKHRCFDSILETNILFYTKWLQKYISFPGFAAFIHFSIYQYCIWKKRVHTYCTVHLCCMRSCLQKTKNHSPQWTSLIHQFCDTGNRGHYGSCHHCVTINKIKMIQGIFWHHSLDSTSATWQKKHHVTEMDDEWFGKISTVRTVRPGVRTWYFLELRYCREK